MFGHQLSNFATDFLLDLGLDFDLDFLTYKFALNQTSVQSTKIGVPRKDVVWQTV